MVRISRTLSVVALVCGLGGGRSDARDEPAPPARSLVAQVGHSAEVLQAVTSADGRLLLTNGADDAAQIWEVATGRALRRFEGLVAGARSASLDGEGRVALLGRRDGTADLHDVVSGERLRTYASPGGAALPSVAIGSGDRLLVGGGADGALRVWRHDRPKEPQRLLRLHAGPIEEVAFFPGGAHVATAGADGLAKRASLAGDDVVTYAGAPGPLHAVAVSPDGLLVATGGQDGRVRLYRAAGGAALRTFDAHAKDVRALAFSPDGRLVVTGGDDGKVRLWEAATGLVGGELTGDTGRVRGLSFAGSDGRALVTAGAEGVPRLWDLSRDEVVRSFEGRGHPLWSTSFSDDGRYLLTTTSQATVHVWRLLGGGEVARFGGGGEAVRVAAFLPGGRRLLTGAQDGRLRLHVTDAGAGASPQVLEAGLGPTTALAVSADGYRALSGDTTGEIVLWDLAAGKPARRFRGHTKAVLSVAFAPKGQAIVSGAEDRTVRFWDAASGALLRTLETEAAPQRVLYAPPDGRLVAWRSQDLEVVLAEAATGRVVGRLPERGAPATDRHTQAITRLCFSPDGAALATCSWDKTAKVWDVSSRRLTHTLVGHGSDIEDVAWSPDGRHLATASPDQTCRLWNPADGVRVCSLISFRDGTWAVFDPEWRFAASNGGEVEGLHWVLGDESVALDQLKESFYEPNLLPQRLGLVDERPRPVDPRSIPALHPAVEVEGPTAESPELRIRLTNRRGGIGRVVVRVNGKERTADARGEKPKPDAASLALELDLAHDPRVLPGENNVIEVEAWNAAGTLRSRGMELVWRAPGRRSETPRLHAIACGVSDYAGVAIDLRYAAKDAEDFARALRIAAGGLLGPSQVDVQLLTSPATADGVPATAANLRAAFATAARVARPDDVFVVYLAGHGVTEGGAEGDFWFLGADATTTDLARLADRAVALASPELTALINAVPAVRRQVLVLDTCASGRLAEQLSAGRGPPSGQTRALDRLQDRTGMFVLAGCAADQSSYESNAYGQGLLTYGLLLGLSCGCGTRDGEYVDVATWFQFAQDTVARVADELGLGGVQRPLLASSRRATSYDVGRVTDDDRRGIPIQAVKPLFVRASFQEASTPGDGLQLTAAVNRALYDVPPQADGRLPLVFMDTDTMSGAHQISGRYVVEAGRARVDVRLGPSGEAATDSFSVEGAVSQGPDVRALAARVVAEASRRVASR